MKAATQGGWLRKHRRLLRRRSSEHEEVALVAAKNMYEHEGSSSTSRSKILALYGVKDEEIQCPVPAPAVSNPKVRETEVEDVIDLTDDPSPGKEPPPATAISKAYFDTNRGKNVKAWDDGSVEEAKTEKGEGGFLVGYFADGSTFTSQVPNVCFELKNPEKFLRQRGRMIKKTQTNKKNIKKTQADQKKGKAKGKAKTKTKKKDEQPQPELAEHHGSQQAEPHQDGLAEKEEKAPVEDYIVKKSL